MNEEHIEKTQFFCVENPGYLKTSIIETNLCASDDGDSAEYLNFKIQVNITGDKIKNDEWIINRTLKEFYNLHHSLIEISLDLEKKYKKLPTITRNILTKTYDENKVSQLKATLNDYLQVYKVFLNVLPIKISIFFFLLKKSL